MGLGTKNRQKQTADLCKEHLRGAHLDQRALVEDFIREIEGSEEAQDIVCWSQFADVKRDSKEMLQRLDERFGKWLRGEV